MDNTAAQEATPENTKSPLPCTVIEQGAHPITPNMLDSDALFVLKKLQQAGFLGFLVGGGVRDLYLGKKPKDFDISTNARPGQLRKLFRNSNTIGRRFRLVQVFFKGGKAIEVSTLRSLSEHDLDGPQAVLAPNNTFGTLDEDAQRRDLTINSLFYEIENHCILDYVGGVTDLQNGVVRMVGEAGKRITRDPVRMMRAIRHSARNDFSIEEETWSAICKQHGELALCPPSRLRDEILKDLYNGKATAWFKLAASSGIFTILFKNYAENLDKPFNADRTCHEQVEALLQVIDNMNMKAINQRVARQADFFLLGLMLIPWAETTFSLLSEPRKGSASFSLGKEIRADLDKNLGTDLNLRRSLRQEITILLLNLPLFITHDTEKGWPNWLMKKSYFQKCLLFYQCYKLSLSDTPLEEIEIEEPEITAEIQEPLSSEPPTPVPPKKRRNSPRKQVISSERKGGIFGFKH